MEPFFPSKVKISTIEEFRKHFDSRPYLFFIPPSVEYFKEPEKFTESQLETYFEVPPTLKEKILKEIRYLRSKYTKKGVVKLLILLILCQFPSGLTASEIKEKLEEFVVFEREKSKIQKRGVNRHLSELKKAGLIRLRHSKYFIPKSIELNYLQKLEEIIKPLNLLKLGLYHLFILSIVERNREKGIRILMEYFKRAFKIPQRGKIGRENWEVVFLELAREFFIPSYLELCQLSWKSEILERVCNKADETSRRDFLLEHYKKHKLSLLLFLWSVYELKKILNSRKVPKRIKSQIKVLLEILPKPVRNATQLRLLETVVNSFSQEEIFFFGQKGKAKEIFRDYFLTPPTLIVTLKPLLLFEKGKGYYFSAEGKKKQVSFDIKSKEGGEEHE